MDLLQLQYFREIARCGTMSKAAERLFVSQPTLSGSLSRLEDGLGVALFERRRGRITLTREGREFLSCVETVLDTLSGGIEALQSGAEDADTSLRIATSLPDLLGDALPCLPGDAFLGAGVRQITCENAKVIEYCEKDLVDLGIVRDPPEGALSPALEFLELDRSERVLMVSRSHPLAKRKSVQLSDLRPYRFVCNHSRDDALFAYLRTRGQLPARIVSECDDDRLEASIVAGSEQLSLLPLANFLKLRGTMPDLPLMTVPLSAPLPPSSIGILRRSGRLLSPQALTLCAGFQSFFEKERAKNAELAKRL